MCRPHSKIKFAAFALALMSLLEFPLHAADSTLESQDRDTHITGAFQMRSALVDENFERSDTVGLGADVAVDHRLMDSLTTRAAIGLNLDTGSTQTTFTDEYKPIQGILLKDAYLDWNALGESHLVAGAINQKWLESPLLVGDLAFPAALARIQATVGIFTIQLSAEQAVPTSDTTHSIPRGDEPLPGADFERATLGINIPNEFTFKAHVGHYAFYDLPSGVALESRVRGNSVTGVGDQGSEFIYDFNGVEAGATLAKHFDSRWDARINASYLTNLRAPLAQSRGMLLSIEASYQIKPSLILTPTATVFRSESDSTPAYYNTSTFAHNNRQGFGAGVMLGFPKNNLEIEGSWVLARVIQVNPFQSDFNGVLLSLKKSYDFF